ncbi:MAG TPA: Fe-only nitrogenase accessory AnfO family protein [Methanomassiliicoccales archaeon]|jgi:Fe-only nitrogenase accessory protein AnfO
MCENDAHEVAAIVEDGATIPLNRPGTVVVYRRDKGVWVKDREMDFKVDPTKGLGEMRSKVGELLKFMEPCKIFVARSASGALFYELEKAQFNVWEIPGKPDTFLEQVWSENEKDRNEAATPLTAAVPVPLESTPGNFFISIKETQGKRPELSSKQILQSFIRKGKFATLEIVCDHAPPWIEMESRTVGFKIETARLGLNEVHLKLIKING